MREAHELSLQCVKDMAQPCHYLHYPCLCSPRQASILSFEALDERIHIKNFQYRQLAMSPQTPLQKEGPSPSSLKSSQSAALAAANSSQTRAPGPGVAASGALPLAVATPRGGVIAASGGMGTRASVAARASCFHMTVADLSIFCNSSAPCFGFSAICDTTTQLAQRRPLLLQTHQRLA